MNPRRTPFRRLLPSSFRETLDRFRERSDILAGMADSGLASLATFLIGIYAVRALEPATLGIYALFFRALFMVGHIPTQLILVPSQVRMVERPIDERLIYLPRSLALALIPAIGSASLLILMPLIIPREASHATIVGLTITASATAFLSPIQDHIRRTLHLSNRSEWASVVSAAQLIGIAVALSILIQAPVPNAWIPFGALALANLFSCGVGLFPVFRLTGQNRSVDLLRFRDLASSGAWLVMTGLLPSATRFASASLVARLAGSVALGYAEGARVVASPILVLAKGLNAILGPRSIRDSQTGDKAQAIQRARRFVGFIMAAAIGFTLLFGWEWVGNLFARLVPIAYEVPGLVALSILAVAIGASAHLRRFEILGARKEARLTALEVVVSVVGIAVAATARLTYAFAIPLSSMTMEIVRWFGFTRILDRHYRNRSKTPVPNLDQ